MVEHSYKIIESDYLDGLKGDTLYITPDPVRKDYDYIGLWYIVDKDEHNSITTEIYTSKKTDQKPSAFQMELKEQWFKNSNRQTLPIDHQSIWVGVRIDNGRYCKLTPGQLKSEKLYINYKMVHNRGTSFDVLGSGTFRGGLAYFLPIYVDFINQDQKSPQAWLYLVFIKDYPPADWQVDPSCVGINLLPIITQVHKFNDRAEYTEWFGQKPSK